MVENLAGTTARDKTYGGFLLRCFGKHAVGSRREDAVMVLSSIVSAIIFEIYADKEILFNF